MRFCSTQSSPSLVPSTNYPEKAIRKALKREPCIFALDLSFSQRLHTAKLFNQPDSNSGKIKVAIEESTKTLKMITFCSKPHSLLGSALYHIKGTTFKKASTQRTLNTIAEGFKINFRATNTSVIVAFPFLHYGIL